MYREIENLQTLIDLHKKSGDESSMRQYQILLNKKIRELDVNQNFVSYDLARLLKEIRFRLPCDAYYSVSEENDSEVNFEMYGDLYFWNKNRERYVNHNERDLCYSAPRLFTVQNWMRERHMIHIEVHFNEYYKLYLGVIINLLNGDIYGDTFCETLNYELTLEKTLIEGIEIIKGSKS